MSLLSNKEKIENVILIDSGVGAFDTISCHIESRIEEAHDGIFHPEDVVRAEDKAIEVGQFFPFDL